MMHVKGGDLDVIGACLPGTPGVVIGRNKRIAWGITNVGADVQDLVQLVPDPEDPVNYYLNGVDRVARTSHVETIQVRGDDDYQLPVATSLYAAVLSLPFLGFPFVYLVSSLCWASRSSATRLSCSWLYSVSFSFDAF